jgi:triacylglycerol lipase
MSLQRAVLGLLLCLCVTGTGRALAWPAGGQAALDVDFPRLLHLATVDETVANDTPVAIQARLGGTYQDIAVVDIPQTDTRYFVGSLDAEKRQLITVRGTVDLTNVILDLEAKLVPDDRLGILLHEGFQKATLSMYGDIQKHLKPGYSLTISGESLGGAVALILGMLFTVDGRDVREIITFGQPMVTDAAGVQRFQDLPLRRVVDAYDPIPRLPPVTSGNPVLASYRHIGGEVLLLDCQYYTYAEQQVVNSEAMRAYWQSKARPDFLPALGQHVITSYVQRLAPKVPQAVQVPFDTWQQYTHLKCAAQDPRH